MQRIARDDLVEVLTGKDRGKRGQVRQILPRKGRVIVQGVNIVCETASPAHAAGRAGGNH